MAFRSVIGTEVLWRLPENTFSSSPAPERLPGDTERPWAVPQRDGACSEPRCGSAAGRAAGAGPAACPPQCPDTSAEPGLEARTPGAGGTGTRPAGFGVSAERDTPLPPWAALPALSHPQCEEVLPHAEVKLVFSLWPLLLVLWLDAPDECGTRGAGPAPGPGLAADGGQVSASRRAPGAAGPGAAPHSQPPGP